MSYRCISAFEFGGVIYPGGVRVEDDAQIIKSHRAFFAHVDEPQTATETTTAGPGELRAAPISAKKVPAKRAPSKAHGNAKSDHHTEESE